MSRSREELSPPLHMTDTVDAEPIAATTTTDLQELDRRHVWHPYAPLPSLLDNVLIESASGATLFVKSNGDKKIALVDGMSSWWAAVHGYNHPHLNAAISSQLTKMSHVMFGGLSHEPAIRLASKLCQLTQQDAVFLPIRVRWRLKWP
jgi:adenosylmethionine---8-amino-7-oxononanoate aminotransferase